MATDDSARFFHYLKFSQVDAGEEPHNRHGCLLIAFEMAEQICHKDIRLDPKGFKTAPWGAAYWGAMKKGCQDHCRFLHKCPKGANSAEDHKGAQKLSESEEGRSRLNFRVSQALDAMQNSLREIDYVRGEWPAVNLAPQILEAVEFWKDNVGEGRVTLVLLYLKRCVLVVYQAEHDCYGIFDSHTHRGRGALISVFPASWFDRVFPDIFAATYPDAVKGTEEQRYYELTFLECNASGVEYPPHSQVWPKPSLTTEE